MALNVPTSGQWITFPVNVLRAVEIQWQENIVQHSAIYYVTRCFFGYIEGQEFTPFKTPPPKTPAPQANTTETVQRPPIEKPWPPKLGIPQVKTGTEKVAVRGATDLFVAAEYFDEHYQGGSLSKYHIKDLTPQGATWLTMKLNECFHYGQNGEFSSLRRFLVYHPIASPAIFQHRFTGLAADKLLTVVAGHSLIAQEVPMLGISEIGVTVSTVTEIAKKITDSLKSTFGHYLHHFLDQANLDEANTRWVAEMKLKYTGKEKDTKDYQAKQDGAFKSLTTAAQNIANSGSQSLASKIADVDVEELADQELYTLMVQVIESATIKRDNAATDEKLKARWKDLETRLEKADSIAEDESKYEQARRNAKKEIANEESPETTAALVKAVSEAPQTAISIVKQSIGRLVLDNVVRDKVCKQLDDDAWSATVMSNADKKVTTSISYAAEANNIQNSGEAKQAFAESKSLRSAQARFASGKMGSASKNAVANNLGGSPSNNVTMGRNSADATAVKK